MSKKILILILILFFPGTALALPDIEVISITLNGECKVVAKVKNNGSAISQEDFENAICYITKGGNFSMIELQDLDTQKVLMSPGGILTRTITSAPIDEAFIKLDMDASNAITESNENNNQKWQELTCPTYHPEDYGDPLISVNNFWLHDDCGVEVELENKGPKSLPPSAYSSSGSRRILGISWANVNRASINFSELDPSHILQQEGGKLRYLIQGSRLNKKFNNTLVKVYIHCPDRSGYEDRKEKALICMPDLEVSKIQHKPDQLKSTERMWFKATVKNTGQITSSACELRFQIGGESNPPIYPVRALAAGQETYINREGNLSKGGNYRITATVDVNKKVDEYREDNNKRLLNVKVIQPKIPCDITIEDIYLNSENFVVIKVKNIGAGAVPDKVWTTLSNNNTSVFIYRNGKSWGGAQIRVIDTQRSLQPPGGTLVYTTSLKISGSTQIKATIDNTGRVVESNEHNNSKTKTLSLTQPLKMKMKRVPLIKK